jgi:branched-chain amino acid transport system ATP-binding protein
MLTLQDLNVSFHGTRVLQGVTFSVTQGETVGIIGPNGCGKTTLFNCISGFADASSGTLTFQGKDISRLPPHQRAQNGLGRVFQNFGIFREMTLLENLLIAIEARRGVAIPLFPWSKRARKNEAIALSYLNEVGLAEKARSKASSLSGGQMRLLEITRTLAVGADLFLLDEPTAGVSPKMKEDVVAIIKRLQTLGKTILIIEHDITFIQKFCSRVIVLNEGRVVLDDVPERVRADERLKDIYFGRDEERVT